MDNHLKSIDIKDFKCFKDFEASGFKRMNLIGGKNNVGKTAFMEACYINLSSINIDSAWRVLSLTKFRRNSLEYIGKTLEFKDIKKDFETTKTVNIDSNINQLYFSVLNCDGKKEYKFKVNSKETIININEFSYSYEKNDSIQFIDNFGLDNSELKDMFEAVQKKDKEEVLYSYINEFDSNIVNFKIIGGDKPQCKVDGEYRDINEFGDGLKHYISIICSLYACENGYLFIDEIDNGIHWTQLNKVWEIILKISKEQNVQLFATTHSKECIESYARISKKFEEKEISFIELGQKNKKIESITYEYDEVIEQIYENQEIRGW